VDGSIHDASISRRGVVLHHIGKLLGARLHAKEVGSVR
jgi:hypothetical protein